MGYYGNNNGGVIAGTNLGTCLVSLKFTWTRGKEQGKRSIGLRGHTTGMSLTALSTFKSEPCPQTRQPFARVMPIGYSIVHANNSVECISHTPLSVRLITVVWPLS
jgi:hypothetical protein